MQYSEMTFVCRIVESINKIIDKEKLPFDRADAEIEIEGGRADLIIWVRRKLEPALLIEVERPEGELQEFFPQVKAKAQRGRIPYFALWNVRQFRLWETPYLGEDCKFYDSRYDKVVINRSVDLEYAMDCHERDIEDFLKYFLAEFAQFYHA